MQRGWPMRGSLAALALAGILGLTYNSLVLNALEQRAEDIAGQVAELKRQLPPGERLVSLNLVHHLFAYHFHDDIEYRPWTGGNYDGEGYRYFCFFQSHDDAPHIPFDWQLVQVVSCDRHRHERPIDKMIVGRRVKEPFDALSEPACDPVSGDGRWAGAAKPALRERARLRQF